MQQLKLFNLVIDDKKHNRYIIESTNGKNQYVYYNPDGTIKKLVGFPYQGRTIKNVDAKSFVMGEVELNNKMNYSKTVVNTRLPVLVGKEKVKVNLFTKYCNVANLEKCLNNLRNQGWSIKLCDTGFYQYMDFER